MHTFLGHPSLCSSLFLVQILLIDRSEIGDCVNSIEILICKSMQANQFAIGKRAEDEMGSSSATLSATLLHLHLRFFSEDRSKEFSLLSAIRTSTEQNNSRKRSRSSLVDDDL